MLSGRRTLTTSVGKKAKSLRSRRTSKVASSGDLSDARPVVDPKTDAIVYTDSSKAFIHVRKGEIVSGDFFPTEERDLYLKRGNIEENRDVSRHINWSRKGGKVVYVKADEDKAKEERILTESIRLHNSFKTLSANHRPSGIELPR